ncbi:MAG: Rho termination factor N-terminal domain-containing protein [Rhodothermales bacterium]
MAKNHGPSVKKDDTYEELRDKGYSKEKSARIANAQANGGQHPSKKGGHAKKYEDRTKDELYEQAKQVGIEGRSKMSKSELIDALRNH